MTHTGTTALSMAAAVALSVSTPLSADPCPEASWARVAKGAPPGRSGHAMAFDAARQRVVLFGGSGSEGAAPGTWLWDGATWSLASMGGPTPRSAPALTYDSRRERVVLFGGYERIPGPVGWRAMDDTWEWNGQNWARVETAGPSARSTAMVFDAARERIVLFGGSSGLGGDPPQFFNDTWEFDGAVWSERAPAVSPPARNGHRLAFETATGRAVMFGGLVLLETTYGVTTRATDETWTYDGATWQRVMGAGPPARTMPAMCDGSPVVLTSGFDHGRNEYFNDVWLWNGAAWWRMPGFGPIALSAPAMAADTARGRAVLFGGSFFSADCSCYTYYSDDTDEWSGIESGAIIAQPTSLEVDAGLLAVFSVFAGGDATFQWRHDGVPLTDDGRITGSTAATLRIEPTRCEDVGVYEVVVTGFACVAVSDPASLSFRVFTRQPEPRSVLTFQSAQLDAEVASVPPATFQWRKDGAPVSNGVYVSGATTPTLRLSITFPDNAGQYELVVHDACGEHTSDRALLSILPNPCPGDANADGAVNMIDLNLVLFQFGQGGGAIPGDVTLDGRVDFIDLNLVLTNFGWVCAPV